MVMIRTMINIVEIEVYDIATSEKLKKEVREVKI